MCIQITDILFVKGTRYMLSTTPLDDYWTKKNPKPEIRIPRTSCYRGYVATWEIIDNCLYIIHLTFHAPERDMGLHYIFPNNPGRVKATWYSGELRVNLGDRIRTNNEVYDDCMFITESDWLIQVKKGEVVNQRYKANY
ncbi:MAG: hypothetical protein JXB49_14170 [Bacteroidales bacterium]|nr:hypothetical protein [Bacteroidales bacterium]